MHNFHYMDTCNDSVGSINPNFSRGSMDKLNLSLLVINQKNTSVIGTGDQSMRGSFCMETINQSQSTVNSNSSILCNQSSVVDTNRT